MWKPNKAVKTKERIEDPLYARFTFYYAYGNNRRYVRDVNRDILPINPRICPGRRLILSNPNVKWMVMNKHRKW